MSKRPKQPPPPPAHSPAGRLATVYSTDFDDALVALAELRADLDAREDQLVIGHRRNGASWTTIGHLLGITRQAAQQRYGGRLASVVVPLRPGRSTGEARRAESERRASDG